MKKIEYILLIIILNITLIYPELQKLYLNEFVQKAVKTNPKFLELMSQKLSLSFNKILSIPSEEYILTIQNNLNLKLNDITGSNDDLSVSLNKLFYDKGRKISADFYTRKGSSSLMFSISENLLKNAFGYSNRLYDTNIEIVTKISEYQISEAYENYFAAIIQLYYNWWNAYTHLRISESIYKKNIKILNNIKEKVKQRIADKTDLNKIELQIFDKNDNLTIQKNNYQSFQNLVAQAILEDNIDSYIPIEPDTYIPLNITFDKAYNLFTQNSRTYKIMKLLREKKITDIKILKDNLKYDLKGIASYKLYGNNQFFGNPNHYVSVGLQLEFPFNKTKEHAEYKKAVIEQKTLNYSIQNEEYQLKTQLLNLYNNIKTELSLIKNSNKKIKVAQEIIDEETKNYRYGRITLNQLINEINDLESKKLNKIEHKIKLHRLYIEWLSLTDNLIK